MTLSKENRQIFELLSKKLTLCSSKSLLLFLYRRILGQKSPKSLEQIPIYKAPILFLDG